MTRMASRTSRTRKRASRAGRAPRHRQPSQPRRSPGRRIRHPLKQRGATARRSRPTTSPRSMRCSRLPTTRPAWRPTRRAMQHSRRRHLPLGSPGPTSPSTRPARWSTWRKMRHLLSTSARAAARAICAASTAATASSGAARITHGARPRLTTTTASHS